MAGAEREGQAEVAAALTGRRYPHAIDFLLLLQAKDFRLALKSQEFVSEVHRKQYYTWANWKTITSEVKSEGV